MSRIKRYQRLQVLEPANFASREIRGQAARPVRPELPMSGDEIFRADVRKYRLNAQYFFVLLRFVCYNLYANELFLSLKLKVYG